MDSKDDNERDSSISYNEFMNNVRGGITPPPPPQVWASAINDDATPPRDIGLSAIPDRHVDPSSMIQPLSSNSNDALDPARSATASNEAISQPSGQDLDRPTLLSALISSSPTYGATEEEITHSVICDERSRDGEENMEEAEDDYAPLPPETLAALFEARKPELTEDNVGASMPYEGHGDEEEKLEEDEDDSAPLPPETIAASFEAAKPKSNEDNDDASILPGQIAAPFEGHGDGAEDNDSAPLPPDMIAASFEGHSDEEEKHEEAEDDGAPAPPEMVALSYEDDTKQEARQNSDVIEDKDGANINNVQGIINSINTSGTFVPGIGANSSPEVVSPANMQSTSTTNEQVGALSITPTPRSANDPSLPVSSQGCAEIAIYPTSAMMAGPCLSIDPSQSASLLEATPVQELPEEPVYDAFPISPTQDVDAHGWSRRFQKYRVITLGLVSVTTAAIIAVGVVVYFDKRIKQTGSNVLADPIMTTTTSSTIVMAVYPTTMHEISPVSDN